MSTLDEPQPPETDDQLVTKLRNLFRGGSTISDETANVVAEAIYSIDAPRLGNETAPFANLAPWERVKFDRMARKAIQAFLEADKPPFEVAGA
jgi:hypothetical protein